MRALLPMLLLVSCVQPNAILETFVELPAAEPGRLSALVQVREWEPGIFDAEWHSAGDLEPLPLGSGPIVDQISIEATRMDVDVALRVSFCSDLRCADDSAARSQAWFLIERPFFLGERSEWRAAVSPTSEAPAELVVARCEIRACVTGDFVPDYCDEVGLHACDRE